MYLFYSVKNKSYSEKKKKIRYLKIKFVSVFFFLFEGKIRKFLKCQLDEPNQTIFIDLVWTKRLQILNQIKPIFCIGSDIFLKWLYDNGIIYLLFFFTKLIPSWYNASAKYNTILLDTSSTCLYILMWDRYWVFILYNMGLYCRCYFI